MTKTERMALLQYRAEIFKKFTEKHISELADQFVIDTKTPESRVDTEKMTYRIAIRATLNNLPEIPEADE